jgi:hypothetical protein
VAPVGGDEKNAMSVAEPQPTSPPRQPFQFRLRSLMLLCLVLGSSLGVFGAWGILVFGMVLGLTVYLHFFWSPAGIAFLVLGTLCLMCMLSLPAIDAARLGRRAQCMNNLKQIALALRTYHEKNGRFPPPYFTDKTGKPMHSWRVLILPYLDLDPLYKRYKFSEPWDGPNNKKVASPVPVYSCPSNGRSSTSSPFETSYVAVVGPKGEWPSMAAKATGMDESPGEIIMVVEVANSGISWMEPKDISIDSAGMTESRSRELVPSSNHGRKSDFFQTYEHCCEINAAMADGSVQCLPVGSLSIDKPRIRWNWPNIAALAIWLLSTGTLLIAAVRSRTIVSPAPPAR